MGRKMMRMERIAKEKTRVMTYRKRKACLLKKAREFSTLCGVDVCLIIYGPSRTAVKAAAEEEEETVAEPETWPTDGNKVHDIIGKYRDTASSSCRKIFQVHDFLPERGKNNNTDSNKIRPKYRVWDEKLGGCSNEELFGILGRIEDKIRKAQGLVGFLEETKRQKRALAEANQQALCGYSYNHIEQQQFLPWPHLGLPVSYSHDPATMESIKTLMMLSRQESYGLFPGFYGGPPHWTQENIVFNGSDQLPSNWVFDPPPVQSSTQANKWEDDSSKNLV
ncbi:PREDICTED: agamous-like MADS-box protein AGL82 [Tarenaya hassleriana]|uniref:agamous-like MADS-box protein AGL82 n=1 Tax=Tarenaya hassleriana TaxID=28532 RepID=UPI00053C44F1|nr:PREDICTED: agamous-like MADS-box protein AGL82 [Tarenaya hassleriana]